MVPVGVICISWQLRRFSCFHFLLSLVLSAALSSLGKEKSSSWLSLSYISALLCGLPKPSTATRSPEIPRMSIPQVQPYLSYFLPALRWAPLASCNTSLTGTVSLILEYQKLTPFPQVSTQSSPILPSLCIRQCAAHTHTPPPPTMAFSHPHLCCFSSRSSASPIILYNVSLIVVCLSRVGMDFCLLLHPQNQERGPTHSRCLTYKLSCT